MRVLRWALLVLGGIPVVLMLAYGFVYLQTESRIQHTFAVNPEPVHLAAQGAQPVGGVSSASFADGKDPLADGDAGAWREDPMAAAVAWGEHIAITRGCRDCHGQDLGGALFADGMPVFKLSAPNLTSGGVGASYTDQDWVRSIQHGIRPNGKPLLYMPSFEYYYLSEYDMASLIAYLRSVPPVQREFDENKVGPLGRVLFITGQLPLLAAEMIDHEAPRPTAPPRGASVAYGEYLAVGCTGCHGSGFSGGPIPGVPPEWPEAMNITPEQETGIGSWTREDFLRAIKEGRRPDGTELRPPFMPWPNFAQFGEDELEALWMYLQTVEPKAYGGM